MLGSSQNFCCYSMFKKKKKKDNKVGFFVGKEDFMLSVFAGFLAHMLEESLLRGCFHFLV